MARSPKRNIAPGVDPVEAPISVAPTRHVERGRPQRVARRPQWRDLVEHGRTEIERRQQIITSEQLHTRGGSGGFWSMRSACNVVGGRHVALRVATASTLPYESARNYAVSCHAISRKVEAEPSARNANEMGTFCGSEAPYSTDRRSGRPCAASSPGYRHRLRSRICADECSLRLVRR